MSFLLAGVLIALAFLARGLQGSWAAPGAFFTAVWVVASIPAVLVLSNFVSPLAVFVVLSFALAAVAGGHLASTFGVSPPPMPRATADTPRRIDGLVWIVFLLGVCGCMGAVSYVRYAGFAMADLFQTDTWLKLAVENSVARYRGDTEPFLVRLLMSMNYAGALLAGVSFNRRLSVPARMLSSLPIVAAFLMTAFTTAKTPMLIGVIFAFCGWLVMRVREGKPVVSMAAKLRRGVWMFIAGGIVAIFFIGSLSLRYGGDGATPDLIAERLVGYGFGQMTALSAWLVTEDWQGQPRTWGTYTFAGAYELLGIARREKGLYEPIGLNEWSSETNVYSALRGLIADFGLPMSWLLIFLITFAAQYCWIRLRAGLGGPFAGIAVMTFYAFAAWSPVVSVLAYNVVLLAIVVSAMVLPFFWKPRRSMPAAALSTAGGES
jgi:oligosaccharide repeat unit polymerase